MTDFNASSFRFFERKVAQGIALSDFSGSLLYHTKNYQGTTTCPFRSGKEAELYPARISRSELPRCCSAIFVLLFSSEVGIIVSEGRALLFPLSADGVTSACKVRRVLDLSFCRSALKLYTYSPSLRSLTLIVTRYGVLSFAQAPYITTKARASIARAFLVNVEIYNRTSTSGKSFFTLPQPSISVARYTEQGPHNQ